MSTTEFMPINRLNASSWVRLDLVQRVRDAIARGDYDRPDRLDSALDSVLDSLTPRGASSTL
ncbi:MAG: hypothetical protein HRU70_07940 [Phycisphaeraceae bacterium]|nr:MAG: hypothetical protein HRU70_07940 [Phycisphaeraceae bacterium]